MLWTINETVRQFRKEVIEKYLLQGCAPPNSPMGKIGQMAVPLAASELNLDPKTIRGWIAREEEAKSLGLPNFAPDWNLFYDNFGDNSEIVYESLPNSDLPIEKILDILEEKTAAKLAHKAETNWQKIRINNDLPTVIAFVGDPHLGDNGCNISLLRRDVALMNKPNVYAVNIGDTTNNWVGSLIRLYAEQDTSRTTELKLVKWFLFESGIKWLYWILGNHDLFNPSFYESIKLLNTTKIPIEDWSGKFNIEFSSGLTIPINSAHDFKGSSQMNKVYGNIKKSREEPDALIYVSGHRHEFGYYAEETYGGNITHSIRARGYKFSDSYARRHGFMQGQQGATVAVVIDPLDIDNNGSIQVFNDLDQAVRYQQYLLKTRQDFKGV